MSNSAGLSTVSELVKQTHLFNNQQYTSAKQGLEFAKTAIKSTNLTYTSQQNKLDNSFRNGTLTKVDYDKQTQQLKYQFEIDCAPWEVYVKKLSQLIETYSSQSELQRNNKRILEKKTSSTENSSSSSSVSKRSRLTFSSSSSDSDTPSSSSIIPSTISKPSNPTITIKYDSSTNTDPLEFSLRSSFSSTPNIIPFTAQTNHITQRIPLQHLNEIAAKQIVLLHDEGQLVRWNDVIWRILTYFHVQDLGNLGIQRADQIACIDNLIRTQNKINTYLDAYTYWQTIGTLNELENDLARIFYKNNFNELLIGPIEKQPKIEELFRLKYLRNEQIKKDLKTSDILKYLDQYMTKEYAWKNEKEINFEDFLKFIAEQIHVKNIYQLGIRIKSVYLARHCIKAMQANQRKTMEIARIELNQMLTDLAQKEVEKILKNINNHEQRQMYASMEPIDIINHLIDNCRELCHNYSSFRKISHALNLIANDSMLKNIFQIALCHGQLTLSESQSKKNISITNKKIYFHSSDSNDDDEEEESITKIKSSESIRNHPNENEIFQAFKEQINSLKILTFNYLFRIEQRLCEKFQIKNFSELGYGSFMNYIQQNEQLLFPIDMKFHFSSSKSNDQLLITRIPLEDIEQFILQAFNQTTNQQYIEQNICYHFQIQSFEQLGYGSYQSVLNKIQENKKLKYTSIYYECLMCDKISLYKSTSLLEDLKKQALHAIDQCPLLGNIHTDTQWNLYFRSQLGQLKSFLIQHTIPILEIDHNTFLKLSTNSTIDLFKESLYNFDPILTAGHLISILLHNNTLNHAPLSLLSNIMHTFYLTISLNDHLYNFLIHIFIRIPFLLLSSIIQRIFLEPLIKLEGSQIKIRELLWQMINKQDPNVFIRFIQLGKQLGFTEWSIDNIHIQPIIKIPPQEKQLSISTSIITSTPPTSFVPSVEQRFSSKNPFDFIEQIRREKFGIGLNLSPESQQLTNQLKSLVGRSLERLSKELYNTDMHFVLELIQNADDNQYNTKPCLIFVIDSNTINIYNNELGFQENHIQALCDIGKSTKGKHKQGYIGQKGIGFKSVFTISDRPEIYSNGYQICFDIHNGSIGYILPNWIDHETKDNEYSNWTTRISLPLKSKTEMEKHKSYSLTKSFNDIHPSLLLFLNRLRSIIIDNRLLNSKQIYERIDISGTNIIEIYSENIRTKWFVVKKQLRIPNEIKINFNDNIEATEIALAFPLHYFQNNQDIKLIQQDVYAYLPLRTFGFTFIIQADFEIPSSRQDIQNDSLWNEFLLNEIPSLFLSSLDVFYQQSSSLPLDPLHLFLYFLPNENFIYNNHLFISVCRKILQTLRSYAFLPVINDNKLHLPNECILIKDITIKEILTPEILYKHLNLYYLKDDLYIHEKQLYELGVHCLNSYQLIEILKQILTYEITFENKEKLSKWFYYLSKYFNELSLNEEDEILKHIKLLKIFPLKNSPKLISLKTDENILFFPTKNFHLPQLIENDLMIIDEILLENHSIQIQKFLEKLGIQYLTHENIYEQHIYPIFENEFKWKEKSSEILVAYVKYIFDLWSKQKHFIDLSRLKSIVQLLTNENFKQPIHNSIHFTMKYGNPYDLSKDFNTYKWILLSDEYLNDTNDQKKLHEFFSQLGVKDFLFPITKFSFEQFKSLIDIQSISINKKLFLILEQIWSNENDLFLQYLKEYKWIPTIKKIFLYNQHIEYDYIHQLDQANQIYLKTKQIQDIFGEHVQYIDLDIQFNSSFINDIGLIKHITLNDILSMLFHWSNMSRFFISILQMQNIYEYIYQNMNIKELQELIQNKSIFFVPISSTLNMTDIIPGKFVGISEINWIDSTNLFQKYSLNQRFILEPYYSEQKKIFLDIFSIPLHPTIDEYIHLLVHISSLHTTKETIEDVFLIFKHIGQWYKQSEDLQNKLSDKTVFPTKDNRWVSLNDYPLISDNDYIAQLFNEFKNIHLINVPSSDVLIFFNLCNMKTLSSSIIIEPIIENLSDGTRIKNLLSPLIPYIQLFMKSRSEFFDVYQWTKSMNMSSFLHKLQFHIIDNLQLIYRYEFDQSISIIENEKFFYDKNHFSFYIHREWIEQTKYYHDIFHEFARIFFPDSTNNHQLIRLLANFMSLLSNQDENNLERFAQYQQFNLEFNDFDDIPWKISSTSQSIQYVEPKIDENKVQTLLEHVAENQKQMKKKYQSNSSQLHLDQIRSNNFPLIVETITNEEHRKNFNIEDLTHEILDNRNSTIGSNQESLEKIGRWGEEWVNEYLEKKYHHQIQSNEIEILWLNQYFEQGQPYDFIIKNIQKNFLYYIEVKSTLSDHRQLIPITYNEIQYCCSLLDKNQHYHIYRIYNTGQIDKVKLKIVENIEEQLRKHQLELFLLI